LSIWQGTETQWTILANKFEMFVQKHINQEPIHIIAIMPYFPKIYPYRFITIHTFEHIPSHFNEVAHIIRTKGIDVDGTPYGRYSLTLHGRGKKYGGSPKHVKYLAGCLVLYDGAHGFQIREKKFGNMVFDHMLKTHMDTNAKLGITKPEIYRGRK